jgi:HIV Tat-specific factor 1
MFQKMHGRYFAGRQIEATLYSGRQRFRRSGAGDDGHGDEALEEKKRLDDFAQWLMTEDD